MASHGGAQLIRLVKNLILTRLLFPDAFGVMSLVWVVMYGLEMFSDVGIASAVIRDQRGEDPVFLNTAWTLQAVRGVVLWGAAWLIAGPMAGFYEQPDLAELIPVAGLTALIAGFNATAVFTCRRRMEFGRLAVLELVNELLSFVAVVGWAMLYPSVWALVGGALISRLSYALMSHFFLPGIRNRFRWEGASLRVLIGFGKWIFLSSVCYFLAGQGDRMMLGYYLSMAQLGVYSVAIMLSEAVNAVVLKITHGVLFPAYGNIVRNEPHRLGSVMDKARLGIDVLLIVPIAVLMMIGSELVDLLYDDRYREAGWMLQLLCIRLLMTCALTNSEACLVALGQPQYAFLKNAFRALWIVLGIPVGWAWAGIEGVVWVVALSEVPVAAVLWVGLLRQQAFSVKSELRSLAFTAAGAALGFGLSALLP